MEVKVADQAGFCFGVKRAVDEALNSRKKYNKKIYTLGPLIHNEDVVNFLKENEIYPVELDDVKNSLEQGDIIIIRSHGVGEEVVRALEEKKLIVINATCPYVLNIQTKVREYYERGYKIIIVGDCKHPEVVGINGWCNYTAIVTKNGSDIKDLPRKVCVVSQTTEKQENWKKALNVIIEQCKEIVALNTICSATEVRQKAADELSKSVDMMIVLGGYNSSNTTKLFEICKKNCSNTIHVENSGEIPDDIFINNKIKKIGITAGASTPEWIIKEAIIKMSDEKYLEMNEQLAFMEENNTSVIVGKVVKGEIISLNEKEAFVNIGYKADGLLPREEVTKDSSVKLTEIFKVGQIVEVKVISRRNEDGYVVLSRIELEREETFKEVKEAYNSGETLNVVVRDAVTGGLVASYKGVRVFIPASHVELFHVGELSKYVGEEIEVKLIEFSEAKRGTKIVASRREILKGEQAKREEEAWNSIETGITVTGEVRRLTDFGAFVNVNGADGLLHVSEISWGRINRASDVLKVGDKIEVYILEADRENKKISLSMKKLTEDPWKNVDVKYPVGNIVLGKVVRFAKFGAFVELEPGVDGMVHISQISQKRINKPDDAIQIDQMVKAKIIDVNKENKKIALSIKEAEEV